jgi:hypothetical protein
VDDLEEVFRRNPQCFYERILHCTRYFADASLVVLSFEHVHFGDGHLRSPFVGIIEPSGDAMSAYCYFSTVGLHLRDAAIHEQFRSRDIAAVVGSEKDDGLRNLVGRSEPAERHEVGHRLAALLACA